MTRLMPRQPVPELTVPTVGGGTFDIHKQKPKAFTLVVFYRGLHCPICKGYLGDLDKKVDDFAAQGTDVIAISSDEEDRAEKTKEDWGLAKLTLGHSLSLEKAAAWGLYISSSIKPMTDRFTGEPDRFPEPGLFLVRPDATLYCASVQTMPFARPHFDDVLGAIKFVQSRDYPARGEITQAA